MKTSKLLSFGIASAVVAGVVALSIATASFLPVGIAVVGSLIVAVCMPE